MAFTIGLGEENSLSTLDTEGGKERSVRSSPTPRGASQLSRHPLCGPCFIALTFAPYLFGRLSTEDLTFIGAEEAALTSHRKL